MIQQALEHDELVLLFPAYLGVGGGDEGWYQEIARAGPSKMHDWGRYVGNRYRSYPNIIWMMGGDTAPAGALDGIRAMVQGIEETAGPQIFSVHNGRGDSGVTEYPQGESWIDINTTYSSSDCRDTAKLLFADYERPGPIPYFLVEGGYENEGATLTCLRSQMYWPILMGATGFIFGNRPVWLFGTGWQGALGTAGAKSVTNARKLFASRRADLVPDTSHTVLIGGYGSLDDGAYAAAARTSTGSSIIVYTPDARVLTVDMSKVAGAQANAWWFNPGTGQATFMATAPTSGTRSFTPPSPGDWVLVIDDADLAQPSPGS